MSKEFPIGGGNGWECKKCGMKYDDYMGDDAYFFGHEKEYLKPFRNGERGEELKNALAVIPDGEISFYVYSYRCPYCNNLKSERCISTSRPSFNRYVIKKYDHHICNRCNHEMVEVSSSDRYQGLICPKCGSRMKITSFFQT